jgi:hypothetical protein
MTPSLSALNARVLAFQDGCTSESFLQLASDVARYQFDHNPPLRSWWKQQGLTFPLESLDALPGVPTDVFRHVDLRTHAAPIVRTFRTSGTTVGLRGSHHRASLDAYDHGAVLHFRSMVSVPPNARFVSLTLDPAAHPDSSLSHMVEVLARSSGAAASYHLRSDGLDIEGFRRRSADAPILCFGTAFAFASLLAHAHPLPPESVLIETGGFKGRHQELDRRTFHADLARAFQLAPTRIYSEYSMTELSSQLYHRPGSGSFIPPHWLHVTAVDPDTLAPLPPNTRGLLRFVDLANVDSVVTIQTSDVGTVSVDQHVELHGRLPGSTPRGCSLAAEEILRVARS